MPFRVRCKLQGQRGGTMLIYLYNQNMLSDDDDSICDTEILDHCSTLIGRRSEVFWLQNEMPDNLQKSDKVANYPPLIFKKIRLFSGLRSSVIEALRHIYQQTAREKKYRLSGIVINLRNQYEITAFETSQILELLRKLAIHFRRTYPINENEQEKGRILLCLPALLPVLNAIARLNCDFENF